MDIKQGIAEDTQATIKCSVCSKQMQKKGLRAGISTFLQHKLNISTFRNKNATVKKCTWSLIAALESGKTSVEPGAAPVGHREAPLEPGAAEVGGT